MHELSITSSIVEACRENAGGRKVVSVTVEIGELSGVDAEAIRFCFDACAAGTTLEGAAFTVEKVAGLGTCRKCGSSFAVHAHYDPCPRCGKYGPAIVAGMELRVKELEVQ